jgi:hypothetical protein
MFIAVHSCGTRDGNEEDRRQMIDTSMRGARCRATRLVRSHQGLVKRMTQGTILYYIDNFGRQLINVEWDNGVTDYVFPFEVEIVDDEGPFGCVA